MQTREQKSMVDRLAAMPALSELTRAELSALCRAGRRVTLPDGWAFVQEQTPADAFYVVLDGQAGIHVGGRRVALLDPGEFVGESALVRAGLRSATVVAVGRVELLRIEYPALARLLVDNPHLSDTVLASHRRHTAEPSTG